MWVDYRSDETEVIIRSSATRFVSWERNTLN